MKTFFFVFGSLVLAVSMAALPGHAGSPMAASATVNGGKRALEIDLNGKGEQGDLGDADGMGNDDDTGDVGGLGGLGGGDGGYRALRGVDDDLGYGDAYPNEDDEVVVAGGAVVRGGVAVARPGRRGFY